MPIVLQLAEPRELGQPEAAATDPLNLLLAEPMPEFPLELTSDRSSAVVAAGPSQLDRSAQADQPAEVPTDLVSCRAAAAVERADQNPEADSSDQPVP